MKLASRLLMVSGVMLAAISAFGYFFWYKPKFGSTVKTNAFTLGPDRNRVTTKLFNG